MMNSSNSVLTGVTIYCEPWTAYTNTKRAIEMALAERKMTDGKAIDDEIKELKKEFEAL